MKEGRENERGKVAATAPRPSRRNDLDIGTGRWFENVVLLHPTVHTLNMSNAQLLPFTWDTRSRAAW